MQFYKSHYTYIMRNSTKSTIFIRLFIILSILTLIDGINDIKHRQEAKEKKEKEEELKFREKFMKGLSVSLKIKESITTVRDRITSRFISENDKRLDPKEEEEEEEEEAKRSMKDDRSRMQELGKEKEYLVVNRTVELLEVKKKLKGITGRSSAAVVLFGREIPEEIVSRILEMGENKDGRDDSGELPGGIKNSVGSDNLGDDNGNNEIFREEYRYGYREFEEPGKGLAVSGERFDRGNRFPEENRKAVHLEPDYDGKPDTGIHGEGLADVLERILFEKIIDICKENPDQLMEGLDFDNDNNYSKDSEDLCEKWLRSESKLEETFLGDLRLPSCPCNYPSRIFYEDKIFDQFHVRNYRWRDVSGENERLDVYKPGASYCIRSLLNRGGGTPSAQHCCYDVKRRLITRGSGAATPNLISPEVSPVLHERIDLLPWRLCKGDFSRFNEARKPNNENLCEENPNDDEYRRQIESTRRY